MTFDEYLSALLKSQTLDEEGTELKELRARGQAVKDLLTAAFGSSPSIRYAGSYIKGTLISSSYDLDLGIRFPRDTKEPGETIEQLFDAVRVALAAEYTLDIKTSAIRLKGVDRNNLDFHIDVVPGRFVNDSDTDVFLHQTTGDKARLKTNLDVHIDHVKDSGAVSAIRVIKVLRDRFMLPWKTFVLELVVVDLLSGQAKLGLAEQVVHVLTKLRDGIDSISVIDPANSNNDLSSAFDTTIRAQIKSAATNAMIQIDAGSWEAVFGPLPSSVADKAAALRKAGANVTAKPWRS